MLMKCKLSMIRSTHLSWSTGYLALHSFRPITGPAERQDCHELHPQTSPGKSASTSSETAVELHLSTLDTPHTHSRTGKSRNQSQWPVCTLSLPLRCPQPPARAGCACEVVSIICCKTIGHEGHFLYAEMLFDDPLERHRHGSSLTVSLQNPRTHLNTTSRRRLTETGTHHTTSPRSSLFPPAPKALPRDTEFHSQKKASWIWIRNTNKPSPTVSRSQRPTATRLSREPTPSSEETTSMLCMELCARLRR